MVQYFNAIWISHNRTIWVSYDWMLSFFRYWSCIQMVGLVHRTEQIERPFEYQTIWNPFKKLVSNVSSIQLVDIQSATEVESWSNVYKSELEPWVLLSLFNLPKIQTFRAMGSWPCVMVNSLSSWAQASSGTRTKSSSSIMCSRRSPGSLSSSGSGLKRGELSMGPGCALRSPSLEEPASKSRPKYFFSCLNQRVSNRYLCKKRKMFWNFRSF